MAKPLTVKAVENAKPGKSRIEMPDGALPGLYLIVQPSGARSWAVRYRRHGVSRKLTLAPYPALSLVEAREAGRAAIRAVAQGRDPAVDKQREKAHPAHPDDMAAVVAEFMKRHVKKHTRESSARETQRIFDREVLPKWKHSPVAEITRRDVIALLDDIADRAPIMANRTLAALRRFFNWCVETARLEASPCVGVKPPGRERKRDRVLSDQELKALWQAAEGEGWPFGPVLKLLILSGARRDEVAEARWSEIDLENSMWTIARSRSKNDKPHAVPLSPQAVAVLEGLPRISKSELVFSTTGKTAVSGFSRLKLRLDAVLSDSAPWTFHDLRRTTASGMARLGIALPVIEKVLNHTSGSFGGIASVYQQHSFNDEKRAALQAWAQFVERLVSDEKPDNVLELKKLVHA